MHRALKDLGSHAGTSCLSAEFHRPQGRAPLARLHATVVLCERWAEMGRSGTLEKLLKKGQAPKTGQLHDCRRITCGLLRLQVHVRLQLGQPWGDHGPENSDSLRAACAGVKLSGNQENHFRARGYLKQLRQSGAPFMMEVAERTDAAPTLDSVTCKGSPRPSSSCMSQP